jgi:formate dehydrogenase major subunit
MPKLGGMLRYGIPEYRLPKAVLDQEIALIADMGVEMKPNFKIGVDATFEEIRSQHDATVVAIGAWSSMSARVPGEELEGVWGGIHMLREIALGNRPNIGEKVCIMGGGNTAMDACRSAVRLGAKEVSIVYRRTLDEMPAEKIEIHEAMEEGVTFRFLRNPVEIIGENGKVKAVKLQVMELGEPDASGRRSPVAVEGKFEILEIDSFIAAIGQKVVPAGFEALELNNKGIIAADEQTFRTNLPDVFAVGDATNRGAGIAIAAIGEANKAAAVVDSFLKGAEVPYRKPYFSERVVCPEMFVEYEKKQRAQMACKPAEVRIKDFNEMNLGFTEEQAREEAKRCLECGCHAYHTCTLIKHANRYEIDPKRFEGDKRQHGSEKKLVVIERDEGKCILCNLCVRTCEEVAGQGLLGLVGRGFTTVIKPEFRDSEKIAVCATCRKCAEACPTGALKILK